MGNGAEYRFSALILQAARPRDFVWNMRAVVASQLTNRKSHQPRINN